MDDRIEGRLGRVLGVGIAVSSAALAAGLALSFALGTGHPVVRTLLDVGLIVLMATPVARVAASAVAFTWERDWLFAGLATTVFIVLMGSVYVALG